MILERVNEIAEVGSVGRVGRVGAWRDMNEVESGANPLTDFARFRGAGLNGIFDDFTYDYPLDWPASSTPIDPGTDYSIFTGGTPTASVNPLPDQTIAPDGGDPTGAYAMETAAAQSASVISAKSAVESAAASGAAVPESAIATLRAAGVDLASVNVPSWLNAAGAVYRVVKSAGGAYSAQPINAAAQQTAATRGASNKSLLYGGLALLALFAAS